ncbi:MAG: dTDP-4-dehydrorhamnose reductase [Adhaeribacter sp.]
MSTIIVFGASGQLGQCLQFVSRQKQINTIHFLPEESANILDQDKLKEVFEQYQPAYCINCAAYTAVDKAEDEVDLARKINCDGARNLARLCQSFGTTLVHISTDFVFAGDGNQPLSESEEAKPINVYGLTKLEGEQAVQQETARHFILRTSWLYSEFGNNFVKTMLRLGKEKEELRIIWDQLGTPTYAIDLATCILDLIGSGSQAYGIYHYSNEGATTWYDFAQAIFDLSHTRVKVLPVRTSEYVTKAIRPPFSVMDKTKIKTNLQISIPHWRESLATCISRL